METNKKGKNKVNLTCIMSLLDAVYTKATDTRHYSEKVLSYIYLDNTPEASDKISKETIMDTVPEKMEVILNGIGNLIEQIEHNLKEIEEHIT